MDDHILNVIAGAFAPTPSGVVGRQIAESVAKALDDIGYMVVHKDTFGAMSHLAASGSLEGFKAPSSLEQAPATEPAPANTDQELKDRLASIEKYLGLR